MGRDGTGWDWMGRGGYGEGTGWVLRDGRIRDGTGGYGMGGYGMGGYGMGGYGMGGYPLLLADSSLLLPVYASQERELTRRLAEQLALHEHGQFKMVKLSELQVRNPSISCDPLPSSAIMYHPLPSLCHPLPSSAILCHHVPSSAIPVRSSAILCHPLPSCAILCHPVPSSAIMYHPLPSCTILCHPVPSSAIPVRSPCDLQRSCEVPWIR